MENSRTKKEHWRTSGYFALLLSIAEGLEPRGYHTSSTGRGQVSHTSKERDLTAVFRACLF